VRWLELLGETAIALFVGLRWWRTRRRHPLRAAGEARSRRARRERERDRESFDEFDEELWWERV
jgi:hypothetical protein